MAFPGRVTSDGATAAAVTLTSMRKEPGKPVNSAQEAIRGPADLLGNDRNAILAPSLKARITELTARLDDQRNRTATVAERVTQQRQSVDDAAKSIQLLQAQLDKETADFLILKGQYDSSEREKAACLHASAETESTLRRTEAYLASLEQMDEEPPAAAGPSEPKPTPKRGREEPAPPQTQAKAGRVLEEPLMRVSGAHDLKLLGEIFPPGTHVVHNGTLSNVLNFNPQTQKFTIRQLIGANLRDIDVSPRDLRYLPNIGEECLVREKKKLDKLQHYFLGRITNVIAPTLSKTSPIVDIEWVEYPEAPKEKKRIIASLDALLPIHRGHPLIGQLLQEPVDQSGVVGTGYFLGKK